MTYGSVFFYDLVGTTDGFSIQQETSYRCFTFYPMTCIPSWSCRISTINWSNESVQLAVWSSFLERWHSKRFKVFVSLEVSSLLCTFLPSLYHLSSSTHSDFWKDIHQQLSSFIDNKHTVHEPWVFTKMLKTAIVHLSTAMRLLTWLPRPAGLALPRRIERYWKHNPGKWRAGS